jgi:spore coat polysaccharide biosynthesis predicted glycosyltransferase SpsG
VIIELAQNQQGIADGLDDAGTAINLGWHEAVDEKVLADAVESLLRKDDHRLQMARRAQELVDGRGAERVLGKMLSSKARVASYVE